MDRGEHRAETLAAVPGRPDLCLEPLGVSLAIWCDDAAALAGVQALCRRWQVREPTRSDRCLHLHLAIVDDGAAATDEAPSLIARARRLHVAGSRVQGWADPRLGRARCAIERGWIESGRFLDEVVEPLLLFLIGHEDRTPIHASACMVDGVAMILAGPTGAGKSCLAYAARRAGLPILSDDTLYVQLRPRLRVWGLPRPIHLYPEDAAEEADAPLRWRNGKRKRAIANPAEHPVLAERAVLCLLERGSAVGLEIREGVAAPFLPLEPGFDLLEAQSRQVYSALSARGHARLRLGTDPAEAIAALRADRGALARIAAR